jgi:hypothetical protein
MGTIPREDMKILSLCGACLDGNRINSKEGRSATQHRPMVLSDLWILEVGKYP